MTSYPSGEVTPNQFRRLVEGKEPLITYVSYDGSIVWHLMGPLAPIVGVQEGVTITRESIKGLIAPWQTLDQAGANQDGVTFNDAVYQPAEIDMVVEAHGLDAFSTRQVIRDWISSWDAHQQGRLYVFTRENGMWWAPVRWLKAPTDALMRAQSNRQRFVWTCRIDDAFWRSAFDSVSANRVAYNDMIDTFDYPTNSDLGTDWPLKYYGAGGGFIHTFNGQAVWRDDPNNLTFTFSREVICGPYRSFATATNNQVITMVYGSIPEISLPVGAFNDIWGRMGRRSDGTWNGYGIRARMGIGYIELARYNNFVKTVMRAHPLIVPPLFGDHFTLVCGYEGDERVFKILRNGIEVLNHKEDDNQSAIGSAYRGIGFGMFAASALITQATPGNVAEISAGDNAQVTQYSHVAVSNNGDIEAWPRYLLYGPGTFHIGNGPNSTDMVEFGPLLDGQVVLIETEPRRRAVVDLSPSAPAAQQLNSFQQLIKALVTFASGNNVPPLLEQFESMFGILPPQGNLYQYLNGRFTQPIPAKQPGGKPVTSFIPVSIVGANASSKVVAALTPRRRWPL